VLDAEVVFAVAGGEERGRIEDVLDRPPAPGRLVVAVRIRRDPVRRSGFVKFAWRRSTGAAVASVALAARDADGSIAEPRLAVGGLAAPGRLPAAEALLAGRRWDDAPVKEAASAAAEEAARGAGLADPGDSRRRLVALGVRQLLERLAKA
jgi:xanthine dehydrogenase small subunit